MVNDSRQYSICTRMVYALSSQWSVANFLWIWIAWLRCRFLFIWTWFCWKNGEFFNLIIFFLNSIHFKVWCVHRSQFIWVKFRKIQFLIQLHYEPNCVLLLFKFFCLISLVNNKKNLFSEPSTRGVLSAYSSINSTIGGFMLFMLNGFVPWRTAAMICLILPVISTISLYLVRIYLWWIIEIRVCVFILNAHYQSIIRFRIKFTLNWYS